MAMSDAGGQPTDWREAHDLMQARESMASALASVENMLVVRYGMPPERRLLLSRSERRRVVQAAVDGANECGERRE